MSILNASARPRALLALADGTVFEGTSIGAAVSKTGEVVFNTALTGYQEILTDPSYCQQIVTLTYPHIGNVGVNSQDEESAEVFASGLIIRDLSSVVSNFRSQGGLQAYLEKAGVPGISDIDTRKLTRILRETGAQNGCLLAEGTPGIEFSAESALALARSFPGLSGMDLAKVVSTKAAYTWSQGEWSLGVNGGVFDESEHRPYHVVALDFGVKRNILRMLSHRGCRITVLPAQSSAQEILKHQPDGVFLSNGPGDPEPCDYAIASIRHVLEETRIPVFGICLGHQLMALASGAKTLKMKFGHHGANHPVQDLDTQQVSITSQNHGFAVNADTLPANLRITHVSLFDGSIQGLARTDRPAFCFQGHPEASPGPHDIAYLFDRFVADMASASSEKKGQHA
ncbi:MAG: glutamine-hydrolyzing carbamoyl-phosphate synthase small subunit [Burkholderiales bacterium]|nr:glutamine-hydrolyzing carbamoyl-phosphate synthase small subunit [Burkholderiales bacterium]